MVARFVGARKIPLVYKPKSDRQRKEQFDPIRLCSVTVCDRPGLCVCVCVLSCQSLPLCPCVWPVCTHGIGVSASSRAQVRVF